MAILRKKKRGGGEANQTSSLFILEDHIVREEKGKERERRERLRPTSLRQGGTGGGGRREGGEKERSHVSFPAMRLCPPQRWNGRERKRGGRKGKRGEGV